jgi:hypothetical protein
MVVANSPYAPRGIAIGRVCRMPGEGFSYHYVGAAGRASYGPVGTKTLAIRKVVSGYRKWIGSLKPGRVR